jgi:hypothetical protein
VASHWGGHDVDPGKQFDLQKSRARQSAFFAHADDTWQHVDRTHVSQPVAAL